MSADVLSCGVASMVAEASSTVLVKPAGRSASGSRSGAGCDLSNRKSAVCAVDALILICCLRVRQPVRSARSAAHYKGQSLTDYLVNKSLYGHGLAVQLPEAVLEV